MAKRTTGGHVQAIMVIAAAALVGCASRSAGNAAMSPGGPRTTRDSRPVTLDVARSGYGAAVYRIPAMAVSSKGTILVAYDARPSMKDLPSHIRVVFRRSIDGGRSFGPAITVRADTAPLGIGDPSLLVDRDTRRILLFYSATVNEGFPGSHTGVSETDPDIQQADLSYSDDDGLTWQHRRITSQIKDSAWGGIFASSGEGIQLRTGLHAGRLVQQYVVRYQGANWALSVWSDDQGETWHRGALAGPGADESKVVELADGRLMLNVRASPFRLVAYSRDGGASWSVLQADSALGDPGNNGSIIRFDPEADPARAQAHWLLLSNTAHATNRQNLTVRLSCDDGNTWPAARTVEPGSSAYSTLTRLPDGRFALLYERDRYRFITFVLFDRHWLGQPC